MRAVTIPVNTAFRGALPLNLSFEPDEGLLYLLKLLTQLMYFVVIRDKHNAVSGNLHSNAGSGFKTGVLKLFSAQV